MAQVKKYKIITFGCKLNQAESAKISADLNLSGLEYNASQPNIIIVNLCAVTQKAVKEGRQKISHLRRKYPQAKIVATGCIAENNWPGVDMWVKKETILKSAAQLIGQGSKFSDKKDSHRTPRRKLLGVNLLNLRSRALIKIQTGCNNFCSYCIVPFTRGSQLVDTPPEKIIEQILAKEKQGFKEVVLTGVNIGLYGKNTKTNLVKLLRIILQQTNIPRIRLGSIWPTHINTELIKLYAQEPRLCPHFHLSIQSGSNKILKLMNRHYTVGEIKTIVKKCRAKIPQINFTTDIIVGFPGETDKDFQASTRLIREIGFSKVHIFKYSPRPGTRAAKFIQQIDIQTKQQRSRELISLAEQVSQQTKQKFIAIQLPVLWEQCRAGYYYGFTSNYIRIKKKNRLGQGLENQIETIKLTKNLLA